MSPQNVQTLNMFVKKARFSDVFDSSEQPRPFWILCTEHIKCPSFIEHTWMLHHSIAFATSPSGLKQTIE